MKKVNTRCETELGVPTYTHTAKEIEEISKSSMSTSIRQKERQMKARNIISLWVSRARTKTLSVEQRSSFAHVSVSGCNGRLAQHTAGGLTRSL